MDIILVSNKLDYKTNKFFNENNTKILYFKFMKFHHIGYLTNNLRLSVNDFKKLNYRKIKKPVIDNNLKVKIQFLKNRNNIIELIKPSQK